MKNSKLVFTFLICILFFSCNEQESYWIDFYWKSSKMGGVNYKKAAIFVDFSLEDENCNFSSQLDTGSTTFFKDSIINSYLKYHPQLNSEIDSINIRSVLNGNKVKYALRNISLNFSDTLLKAKKINFYPKARKSYDSLFFKKNKAHLGTLGIDLFRDKTLIIDYPKERFTLLNQIPAKYVKDKIIELELDQLGRVYFPIYLTKEKYLIMYDTGSSIFPLITHNEKFWKSLLKENSKIDSLKVNSFGKL